LAELINRSCLLFYWQISFLYIKIRSLEEKHVFDMNITYQPTLPTTLYPIYIIGAGSIVKDAHLPAYKLAGFSVAGITNRDRGKAESLAGEWNVGTVFSSVEEMVQAAPPEAVYDLTLPADLFAQTLRLLPDGAAVLIQKPMGEFMSQAREILQVCREKKLIAALNFQLRFAPFVMAAKDLIDRGVIGELQDMEIRVTTETPWDHFPFLQKVPRLEIVYHSVHHIDCIRHFLGDPDKVQALTLKHPDWPQFPSTRSSILMNYGDRVRANIQTNHHHRYGPQHQESYIKWEGSQGAIKAKMGLLMNYPHGVPDCFEVCELTEGKPGPWQEIRLEGSWFPHAFVGAMAQVMRAKAGEANALVTSVEDSIKTMACVEAAYAASEQGGISIAGYL
jgi:predicted dehydrogenase